jgi:ferritin-like metal-binding protein YciE
MASAIAGPSADYSCGCASQTGFALFASGGLQYLWDGNTLFPVRRQTAYVSGVLVEELMGLFSHLMLESMDDLLIVEIEELYDAERRLTKALPKMMEAAFDNRLKVAFREHMRETVEHVARLEKIFSLLDQSPTITTCEVMESLIAGGEAVISALAEDEIRDAALIAAVQRVEHFEIAAYTSARAFAADVGRSDIAQLLKMTLHEEQRANDRLTEIAEELLTKTAA